MGICLASITSAKSFVSSFYDVYLSTSASLEMIWQITLTKFLFDFITFLILVRIYVLYIYVSERSMFIPEIKSIVCYPLLVAIKLNIGFSTCLLVNHLRKSEFAIDYANLYWAVACRYWPISLAYTSNQSDQFITSRFFKNTKHFLILF